MQGRISVPKAIATASQELQTVIKSTNGCFVFIGPIKVHLRSEGSMKKKLTMKRKIAALQETQIEMQKALKHMSALLQKQLDDADLPSPGRESSCLNCELKRAASTNMVYEKQQKIQKHEGIVERSTLNTERASDEFSPEHLDAVIEDVERRLYREHPLRNDSKETAQIKRFLQGVIDGEESSISSMIFDDVGD